MMPRSLFALALLMLGGNALAADPARGEALFNNNCTRCHTARQAKTDEELKDKEPPRLKLPSAGPDLAWIVRHRDADKLRAWMDAPWKQSKDTLCVTDSLPKDGIDDVLAFLAVRPFKPVPPLEVRRKAELEAVPVGHPAKHYNTNVAQEGKK